MKKNLIISVLIVTNVLFIAFAIVQKINADEQRKLAVQYQEQAEQQRIIAEDARMQTQQGHARLVEALREAELQRQVAEQQLIRSQKQSR